MVVTAALPGSYTVYFYNLCEKEKTEVWLLFAVTLVY